MRKPDSEKKESWIRNTKFFLGIEKYYELSVSGTNDKIVNSHDPRERERESKIASRTERETE